MAVPGNIYHPIIDDVQDGSSTPVTISGVGFVITMVFVLLCIVWAYEN